MNTVKNWLIKTGACCLITLGMMPNHANACHCTVGLEVIEVSCPLKQVKFRIIECSSGTIVTNTNQLTDGFTVNINIPGNPITLTEADFTNIGVMTYTFQSNGTYLLELIVPEFNGAPNCSNDQSDPGDVANVVVDCDAINVAELGLACCEGSFPIRQLGTTTVADVGEFGIDDVTGKLVFEEDDCPASYTFNCLQQSGLWLDYQKVVAAHAGTFSDDWDYEDELYFADYSNHDWNPYETGKKGKWRSDESYVYNSAIDRDKNYNSGTYIMTVFDWDNLSNNDPLVWLKESDIVKYTPNGRVRMDYNSKGIPSSTNQGYQHTIGTFMVTHAESEAATYKSYENIYDQNTGRLKSLPTNNDYFEDRIPFYAANADYNTSKAHTGKASLIYKNNGILPLGSTKLPNASISEGLLVRVWVHVNPRKADPDDRITLNYGKNVISTGGGWFASVPLKKAASAGEWSLFETSLSTSELNEMVTATGFNVLTDELSYGVQVDYPGTADPEDNFEDGDILLDDFRVQPMNSSMICRVYDDAQRMIAVFDDQHFAMLFEYNAEGVLVRKLKETVEGIKTITETNYNNKGIPRTEFFD